MDDFDFNRTARGMAITGVIITLIWASAILGGLYMLIKAFT